MSEKIINKIIEETVETIIDNIDEKFVDYMFEYGDYKESDDRFFDDKEEMFVQVIKELSDRIKNIK